MALFSQASVRAAGRRAAASAGVSAQVQLRQLAEGTPPDRQFDIFLSHSYLDSELVLGLKATIETMHHSVYVDWVEDDHLARSDVSRGTAEASSSEDVEFPIAVLCLLWHFRLL